MRFTIIRWASAAICCVLVFSLFYTARAERLSGVVLDSNGAPVAGARVLSSDTKPPTQATTGVNGKFVLENLAPEFVGIVALHPEKGWASTRQISGGSDVELKLKPFSPPFTHDRARAEKILTDLWLWSDGVEHVDRSALWAILTPYDLERAIKLSKSADGTLPDAFVTRVIAILGRNDPAKAAEWGVPRLDDIKSSMLHNFAAAMLAGRVAEINPQLANELYERASVVRDVDDLHFADELLMELAIQLKRPEAQTLIQRRLEQARKDDAENEIEEDEYFRDDRSAEAALIGTIAGFDMAQAERLMESLDEIKRADAQARVIGVLTRQGGVDKLTKAQDFLEKIAANSNPQARKYFAPSALSLLLAVGKTDSAQALGLARRVTEKDARPEALAAAARYQDDATAEGLLREAADAALQHSSPIGQLSNIALAATPKFSALARGVTAQALQLWERAMPEQRDAYWRNDAASSLATALAQTDKLAARALLEMEWARIYPTAAKGSKVDFLRDITYAMAQLDFERALGMARSIPEGEMGFVFARFGAQRALARMLLVGPQEWNSSSGYSWNRVEQSGSM